MRIWVQDLGNLTSLETPEFVGNIPYATCKSQAIER